MLCRILFALGGCGFALGLPGLCLAASQGLDSTLGRYPGSVRLANVELEVHRFDRHAIERQATDQTTDQVALVRRWYAERLHISPASEQSLVGADGCAWLTQSSRIMSVQHSISVLSCQRPPGTRVVINESWSLGP